MTINVDSHVPHTFMSFFDLWRLVLQKYKCQVSTKSLIATEPIRFVHFHLISDTTMYSFSVRLEGNTELDDGPCIFNVVDVNIDNVYNEFSGI